MAQRTWSLFLAIAGLSANATGAILDDSFHGIAFGSSMESARVHLEGSCRELSEVKVAPPTFPLATVSESHLICLGLSAGGGGQISEVAFSFADGRLALIEARRGAVEVLVPKAGELSASIAGYHAYTSSWTLAHVDQDAVWVLTEDAARAHLFLWRNPALPANSRGAADASFSVAVPAALAFGATLETMAKRMEQDCQGIDVQEIAHPWLPSKPKRQTQINCYGYPFAGFPRKIEAVFGDGRLELAWILTGKAEEARIRRALIDSYGPAEIESPDYEAFDGGRVALRKDRPEVLVLAESLIPLYRKTFAGSE